MLPLCSQVSLESNQVGFGVKEEELIQDLTCRPVTYHRLLCEVHRQFSYFAVRGQVKRVQDYMK